MKKLVVYIFCWFVFAQLTQSQTFQNGNYPEYLLINTTPERLSTIDPNTSKESDNWIKKWLWNNRFDIKPDGTMMFNDFSENDYLKINEKDNDISLLSTSNWVPLGPIIVPPSYEPRSCYSIGRVNCIAFHPKDAKIFWVGTPGGGIWKTVNSGKSWIPQGDKLKSLAISHIAVDPIKPDILYAATGDFDGSGYTSENAIGIIKSVDGGNTWNLTKLSTDSNFRNSCLKKVIINPSNTSEIITAGRLGIWKSTDSGDSWKFVNSNTFTDMEISPTSSNLLYAAMSGKREKGAPGVFKTTNFGETWELLNTNIPDTLNVSRVDIAISPVDPNYLFLLNADYRTNAFHSFLQSTDSGNSWTVQSVIDTTNNILGAWGGDQSDSRGQAGYDLVLLPDPIDKSKVYAAATNIWMSSNYGTDWDIASFWIYCFGPSIHADHHYAEYNPLDQYMYWCNDGGVYRTKAIGAGSKSWINEWVDKYEENVKPNTPDFKFPTQWENISDGLAITEFYKVSICRNKPNIFAGGSQDNSCYIYNNGNWLNYIPNYDGMETMIDNDNPDIFYGVWQNGGLCKTTDGGKTLKTRLANSTGEYGNWVTPIGMDPFNSNTIYIGYRNLWQSTDAGEQWTMALCFDSLSTLPLKNKSLLSIVRNSYSDSKSMAVYKNSGSYQDTGKVWRRSPGELWITEDGCKTWEKSTNGLPLDSMDITSIDYDRTNSKKMWVSFYSYFSKINTYLTTDGGESWTDISKPMPSGLRISTIVHQPNTDNNLFAGTNHGVYYIDDTTKTWTPFNNNLPNCIIRELRIQESTNEIIAATYGRGIWKTGIIIADVNEYSTKEPNISIYPNPTTNSFQIAITNDNTNLPNSFKVKIVNITGRSVFEKAISLTNLDEFIDPLLDNGVYFVVIEFDNKSYSTKLIINK